MERKRRLLYLEKDNKFRVPKSTRHYRERKRTSQTQSPTGPDVCGATSGSDDDDELRAGSPVDSVASELQENETFDESIEIDKEEDEVLTACLEEFGDDVLPNCSTTKAAALTMITSFVVAHGLTWTALDDLLSMINCMFAPAMDTLPRSKHLFRKLWSSKVKDVITYHYYCEVCTSPLDETEEEKLYCPICNKHLVKKQLKESGCFFVLFDMHHQIGQVVSKTKSTLHTNLTKLANKGSAVMTDVSEGKARSTLEDMSVLGESDLTLTLNTDGSPLFKSSKTSVWPIQFLVNELPPAERFENCALAGIWFGSQHPDMTVYIGKFVEKLNSMKPLNWHHAGVQHHSHAYGLCWSVDAPARAAVQNYVTFNGYLACPWCLARGEHHNGKMLYLLGSIPNRG